MVYVTRMSIAMIFFLPWNKAGFFKYAYVIWHD